MGARVRHAGVQILAAIALAAALAIAGSGAAGADKDPCRITKGCHTLTINLGGNGAGSWESTDASFVPDGRISCQRSGGVSFGRCSHAFPPGGTYYKVTAPAGSRACEAGDCSQPSGFKGHLDFPEDITQSRIYFELVTPVTLAVSTSGSGSVTSVPVGIDCGSRCSTEFGAGADMALKAVAGAGYSFGSWTGPCAGQDSSCAFVLSQAGATTSATFTKNVVPTPTPKATPKPAASPAKAPTTTVQPAATPKSSAVTTSLGGASPSGQSGQPSGAEGTITAVVASTPAPTLNPASAASTGAATDLTPIVLAILLAGLFAGVGFAWFAREGRRRPR